MDIGPFNNLIIDHDLNIKYIEDAYICGGRSDWDSYNLIIKVKNKFEEIIDHSPYRESLNDRRFCPTNAPATIVNGPYIFGGLVSHHYGHFITETLSRFTLCKQFSLKFALFSHNMPQLYKDFLNDCNVPYDVFNIQTNNFIFKQIFIPAPGFTLGMSNHNNVSYYHKNLGKMLDTQVVPSKNKILYISKKKFLLQNTGFSVIDYNIEQKIEDLLTSKYGAHIMYPDELSIKDQINTINEHEIIIGPIGSNMHTILLAKDPKKVIYILPTPPTNEPGSIAGRGRMMGYIKTDIIKSNKAFYIMENEIDAELEKILDYLTGEDGTDYIRWAGRKERCDNNRSGS
jgi:capsular polysaccharide biosynthesis protein